MKIICKLFGHNYPLISLWGQVRNPIEKVLKTKHTCIRCKEFNKKAYEEQLQDQNDFKEQLQDQLDKLDILKYIPKIFSPLPPTLPHIAPLTEKYRNLSQCRKILHNKFFKCLKINTLIIVIFTFSLHKVTFLFHYFFLVTKGGAFKMGGIRAI